MAGTIRVLIADGHVAVRRGLHVVLSSEPDLEIVGEAADGISAVISAQALQPDVLVMGLRMPDIPGVQVIEEIAATAPDVRALVLSIFTDDRHVFSALRAGAQGYLLKDDATADEIVRAIRDVAVGKPALHPTVARRILR